MQAILFDAHETLITKGGAASLGPALAACALFLQNRGYEVTVQDYQEGWRQAGQSARRLHQEGKEIDYYGWYREILLALNIPWLGKGEVDQLNKAFMQGSAGRTIPLPGASEVLHELKARYKLGVVSNSMGPNTRLDLQRAGLLDFFELVVTSTDIGWRKPSPELFVWALQKLNVEAGSTVFVGDNYEEDILGGHRAGMKTVLFDRMRGWRQPGGNPPPSAVITELKQLPGVLLQWR